MDYRFIYVAFIFLIQLGCSSSHSNKSTPKTKVSTQINENQLAKRDTNISEQEARAIIALLEMFKTNNINQIVKHIQYPLKREYPIPPITNEQEMRERFREVFDDQFMNELKVSTWEDWSEVGWRGVMFKNGSLWLSEPLDTLITAVNYQSAVEKYRWEELVEQDKMKIYSSLQSFQKPIYKFVTKRFLIRIDELAENKYRYACWKVGSSESAAPDLILTNGIMTFSGTGGNHEISFTHNEYTYIIYRNIIGENGMPEIELVVEKNGNEIVNEAGKLLLE